MPGAVLAGGGDAIEAGLLRVGKGQELAATQPLEQALADGRQSDFDAGIAGLQPQIARLTDESGRLGLAQRARAR